MTYIQPLFYLPVWMHAAVLFLGAYFITSLIESRFGAIFAGFSVASSFYMLTLLAPVMSSW